jgi:class 3 adenylate cyclase
MPAVTIADWLTEIGLEQYIDAFEREQIGLDLVPDLADADLVQLGLPMGPRKRVLKAAAAMSEVAAVRPPAAFSGQAQRRQLTVMFCDLVGSTALSQSLDPEDLREVMRSYQDAARLVIQRYDGHIAQYLGDGVMVYFGWPAGHGDEARRAVRSGLEIVEAVAHLDASVKLEVRVGIATGMVVIGETGDGDASDPRTAVGDTPNIAARLQALAQPGMVVIGQLTRALAREAFEYQSLGEHSLKGIAEPVQAWSVVSVRDEAPEQEDQTALGARVLVGREEEIGLLQRAWQQSKDRRGSVVLVSGEPGIGKSALVESLLSQLHDEGVRRMVVRCSAYHASSALYPVIEYVKKLVGWQTTDALEEIVTRLERRLQSDGLPTEEFVPTLASLLSLPLPDGRYAPLTLTPQQIKQRILDNLAEWLFTTVDVQPAVMVWEDLHWADPSTLEYLGLLIEQSPTAPLLLVLTFRPDFSPPWTARSHLTPITLNRLEPPQIEHMVNRLAKGKSVPEQVLDHIVRKTDGVPLFVEELTKTILGSSVLHETDTRFELAGPLSSVAIPATLHESLMARLDRLPLAREIAQLGAVLGREFSYEVLLALGHGKEPTVLEEGLTELIAGEVLYQRGRPPRARYVFKHALIQEAAYQSLLKRVRRQYHREVAELLETRFPQQAETEPELVAYHYAGADMAPEAIGYWLKAAKRASNRSAYREALTHLDAGTALLEGLPAGRDRIQLEVQTQVARAGALHATMGLTDKTTIEAYSAAEALCRQLGEEGKEIHMQVLWQLTASAGVRGEWQRSYTGASELLGHAEAAHDTPSLMSAHRIIGFSLFCMGDPARGRGNLEQAVALYEYDAHTMDSQRPTARTLASAPWRSCRGPSSCWALSTRRWNGRARQLRWQSGSRIRTPKRTRCTTPRSSISSVASTTRPSHCPKHPWGCRTAMGSRSGVRCRRS